MSNRAILWATVVVCSCLMVQGAANARAGVGMDAVTAALCEDRSGAAVSDDLGSAIDWLEGWRMTVPDALADWTLVDAETLHRKLLDCGANEPLSLKSVLASAEEAKAVGERLTALEDAMQGYM